MHKLLHKHIIPSMCIAITTDLVISSIVKPTLQMVKHVASDRVVTPMSNVLSCMAGPPWSLTGHKSTLTLANMDQW